MSELLLSGFMFTHEMSCTLIELLGLTAMAAAEGGNVKTVVGGTPSPSSPATMAIGGFIAAATFTAEEDEPDIAKIPPPKIGCC